MHISFVVAVSKNGVIGNNNRLPWHLPEDLKHFKQVTMGHAIIMGRKTFDSIGRALPGRQNIVLSRKPCDLPEGVWLCNTVASALEQAKAYAKAHQQDELMVIGGEQIYQALMPYATRLYLTLVDADVEGDARFDYQQSDWQIKEQQRFLKSENNPYDYSFCLLEKK